MLQTLADLGSAIGGIGLLIAVVALVKQLRAQNLQSLFYLHQYLAQDAFSAARQRVRTRLHAVAYGDWTDDDKAAANKVCSSYDQAGLLIGAGVLAKDTRKVFLSSSWGESVCDQYESLEPFLDAQQTPTRTGREFFAHFTALYTEASQFHRTSAE